jgi:hypothetical protein
MMRPAIWKSQKALALVALVALLWAPLTGHAAFTDGTGGLSLGTLKAAWGDYNNDNWTDLYTTAGLFNTGIVWRNNRESGGGVHDGFSEAAGGGKGGMWGDYNNDGFLDVFASGRDVWSLTRNVNGGAFVLTDGAIPANDPWVNFRATGSASCWVDVDNDGYLDLYVGGYEEDLSTPLNDVLLINDQDGTFTQHNQGGTGHIRGITACDYDQDGNVEVFLSAYRQLPNRLLEYAGGGSFTDEAGTAEVTGSTVAVSPAFQPYGHTIGSAWGDMDNDGDFDLATINLNHHDNPRWSDDSKFYSNDGDGTFTDVSTPVALAWQEFFTCPALGDFDNDGDLDMFITDTGQTGQFAVLLRNDGLWSFIDVTASENLNNLVGGFQAAWADIDNDGDLDLATNGMIHINNLNNGNHWLKVRLRGNGVTVNSAAIGAQIRISVDHDSNGGTPNITVTRQVEGGTGQGSQNDLTCHFGLGSHSDPVDVEITWPGGTMQTVSGVAVDQLLVVDTSACPEGDTDGDCGVDMIDFANVAADWMEVGTPQ